MTNKAIFFLFFYLFFVSVAIAQKKQIQIPQNFLEQKPCVSFLNGREVLAVKHLLLPNSNFLLVYLAVQRTEEQDRWSPDKADHLSAKMFVYDLDSAKISDEQTNELNKKLGADQHYNNNFCGGLGSVNLEKMAVVGNHILLPQSYNPGTISNTCYQKIIYSLANKQIIVKMGGNEPMARRKNRTNK